MASFLLQRAGVATPETFVTQNYAQARAIARRECHKGPLVMKPLFGAQGWGLRLINDEADIPSNEEARGVFYLQRFVGPARPPFEDMRILVAHGEIIAAMRRRSSHWVTNVRQGAQPVAITPTQQQSTLAVAAAHALDTDIAGVDLIEDPQGALMVLEVNSMAGWHGLQKVTPFSIAERLAARALDQLQ
jgi:RimK family alpha-L-glutamate ligase